MALSQRSASGSGHGSRGTVCIAGEKELMIAPTPLASWRGYRTVNAVVTGSSPVSPPN
jgi:hypothetical protein